MATEDGDGSPPPVRRSPLAGRTRGLAVIVAVAVVAAAVGFLASRWVKSPAELAAETAPPPASLITAPVEERVVEDTLVTRGTVGSVSTVDAIPAEAPPGVAAALVTRIPVRAGARLEPGDVVVEISGRPVFFLPGRLPAYRDLGPGDVGPDVTQLQEALRRAGHPVDDPPGRYGTGTATAVRTLFTDHGYPIAGAGALPRSAVAYVDTDTSTLVVARASLGQPAADADLQLASGDLVVFVDTAAADAGLIQEGGTVALTAELIGQTATGVVTQVGTGPDGRATIVPDGRLDPAWAGQDVRVDIAGAGSGGEVLAVPVTAVSLDGGGRTTVTVVRDGTVEDTVEVVVGAAGDGYVEVSSTEGELRPGDRVVVGVG